MARGRARTGSGAGQAIDLTAEANNPPPERTRKDYVMERIAAIDSKEVTNDERLADLNATAQGIDARLGGTGHFYSYPTQ